MKFSHVSQLITFCSLFGNDIVAQHRAAPYRTNHCGNTEDMWLCKMGMG